MKFIQQMSIRLSWSLVLGVFALLVVWLSGLGLYAVHQAEHSQSQHLAFSQQQARHLEQIQALQAVALQIQRVRLMLVGEQSALTHATPRAPYKADAAQLNSYLNQLQNEFNALERMPWSVENRAALASVQAAFGTLFNEGMSPQAQALIQGRAHTASQYGAASHVHGQAFSAAFDQLIEQLADVPQAALDMDQWTQIRGAIWLAVLVFLGTFVVIVWGVITNVIRPLHRLVERSERIAAGDLTEHIEVRSTNEISQLFGGLLKIQQQLSEAVGTVRQSSQLIERDAQNIAEGSRNLASRTLEGAASLENTASSMEQLTATVAQNADNASQASQLAGNAAKAAGRGGEVMSDVIRTMGEISSSSHEVAEIIKLIDSIAFQTNLLALNASVEAARAGEQGRGFAVVAGEVRNLAGRSAQASKEIRELIVASLQRVDNGSALVSEAGQTMQEIVESVQRVADIMDEIAAASQEQNHGITLVDQAVGQLDSVIQQNTTLAQEASNSSEELAKEARHLREAVRRFRIKEDVIQNLAARTHNVRTTHTAGQVRNALPAAQPNRAATEEHHDWKSF